VYVIVWEFRIRPDAEQQFLEGYGADGSWARLFRRGEGYVGTELARSVGDPQVFYTLDRWQSESCYRRFREAFEREYEALDRSFEGLTAEERLVGVMSAPAKAG
jgi:heme-degrading monooxygenase HmoA